MIAGYYSSVYSKQCFVSIDGANEITHDGSELLPWASLSYAINQIESGDSLIVLPGRYFETEKTIYITEDKNNVTIIGRGNAILDGSYEEFQITDIDSWELWDTTKKIYRSINVFPNGGSISGSFVFQNQIFQFLSVRYSTNNYFNYYDLSSENEFHIDSDPDSIGIYVGPGIFYDRFGVIGDTGRIYCRMKKSSFMTANFSEIPDNPNNIPMYIKSWHSYLRLQNCSGIHLENLILQSFSISLRDSSHNIDFKNLILSNSINVRDQGCHNVLFDKVHFEHGIAPWVAWQDVKAHTRPAAIYEAQAINIGADCHDITIKNCVFNRCWDAIDITSNSFNIDINNNYFKDIRDDCVQLGSACYNVDIYYNSMQLIAAAISRHGSGDPPQGKIGKKFIHHNIIDASKPSRIGRPYIDGTYLSWYGGINNTGFNCFAPFGYHNADGFGSSGDPRMIYNNTVIFGSFTHGASIGFYGITNRITDIKHKVLQNIFVQYYNGPLDGYSIFTDGSMLCDGNLYFRMDSSSNESLFTKVDNPPGTSYDNFYSFRDATGFEQNGYYADPEIDKNFVPQSLLAWGGVDIKTLYPEIPFRDSHIFKGALLPKTSSISGSVINQEGNPIMDVDISLSGYQNRNYSSNISGNFDIDSIIPIYNYTVLPEKEYFTFIPEYINIGNLHNDTAIVFIGVHDTYSIFGRVTDVDNSPINGAEIVLFGARNDSILTDLNGEYRFSELKAGEDYTIVISESNYDFPVSKIDIIELSKDEIINFTAFRKYYSISGFIKNQEGEATQNALIYISGGLDSVAVSESSGFYIFPYLKSGEDYSMQAFLDQHELIPDTVLIINLKNDTTINFTSAKVSHNISGYIKYQDSIRIENVEISLTEHDNLSTQSDANGFYIFYDVPALNSYKITPDKKYHSFVPVEYNIENLISDTLIDFTAIKHRFKIQGKTLTKDGKGIDSVRIALSGNGNNASVTNESGNFSFTNLEPEEAYFITPHKSDYIFTPEKLEIDKLISDTIIIFIGVNDISSVISQKESGFDINDYSYIYPNPTTNSVRLRFITQIPTDLKISLTDSNGKEINTSNYINFTIGTHIIEYDCCKLPNGTYFLTLTGTNFKKTLKMVKDG